MKQRIAYFDIAKGIGMLCIIAGHMGVAAINDVVFTFHVPLFFIISVFFISFSEDFVVYARKRFKDLIYPYIYCSIGLLLIRIPINVIKGTQERIVPELMSIFLQALYGSGGNENITLFGIKQIGAIWFLWALFWALLIVKSLVNKKHGAYLIFLIAAISYISSKFVWLPLDLQAGGVASLFVYVGALIKKNRSNLFDESNDALFLSGILTLIISSTMGFQLYINTNYYCKGIVSIICALLISCFVIYISRFIEKFSLFSEILKFYGVNSIYILCFHLLELNNINYGKYVNNISLPYELQILLIFAFKIFFVTVCTVVYLKFSDYIKCHFTK